MTDDPFDSARSGFDSLSDLEGHLILITPIEHLKDVKTVHGPKDPIEADIVDLDDDGTEYPDLRIFSGPVIGVLKRAVKFNMQYPSGDPQTGRLKMVLGRLHKGEAKKGQQPPWLLAAPSDDDKQLARDYLAKKPVDDPFTV